MATSHRQRHWPALALLSASACWTSAQHGELIDQRLAALEADSRDERQVLETQRQDLAAQLPKLDAKLKEVSEALDRINQATHQSGADVGVRLDEMQERLQQLRGAVEETQHRLDQLATSEQSVQATQDRKLAAALGPQALAAADARAKAMQLAPAERPALYALAAQHLSQKDFDVSRELFLEYLRRYPKDPQAGDAQYGIGQTFYGVGRFKDAAVAFGRVPEGYPGSAKVCDARLALGLSFLGLKLRDDARAALEETLSKCGGKVAIARQARARLSELKKK